MSTAPLSPGSVTPWTNWGEYNRIAFVVQQLISKVQTATIVRVETCTNDGDLSPVGFVDVTPLVNQIDGNGLSTLHGIITGLPYLRVQGGTNAIIMDPQPGDLGIAIFASRDLSNVKTTRAQSTPGSRRTYDFSDGMYLGGLLNGAPTQFIQFTEDGVTVTSPTLITLKAPTIALEGDVTMSETLTVTGTATADGVSLSEHVHPFPTVPPTGNTGPPLL